MDKDAGSFRDPSGYVFREGNAVFRTIHHVYREEWEYVSSAGLLEKADQQGMLIPFDEIPQDQHPVMTHSPERIWKVLRAETVPFLSYPYEWCFSQLKDAALLTLALQKLALEHGCILKDASAFNVQYVRGKPIFIDILSFERWREGEPWQAYGQFCAHFLAPLSLMAKKDIRFGLLSRQWLHGIPLDFACRLLPFTSRLSPGLFFHLHLHASMQRRHADDGRLIGKRARKPRLNRQQMLDIADSLTTTVTRLHLPHQDSEWGAYYEDTNYSPAASEAKRRLVAKCAVRGGKLAVDLGANTGLYSDLLAQDFTTVIAADIDPLAVERHYNANPPASVLPLILDFTSPTPGTGWACSERSSFADRCRADMLLALALCHHLSITFGVPLGLISEYMASLLNSQGTAVVEFIPRGDSQLQRMLATRDDIFTDYDLEHFLAAFSSSGFVEEERHALPESLRTCATPDSLGLNVIRDQVGLTGI